MNCLYIRLIKRLNNRLTKLTLKQKGHELNFDGVRKIINRSSAI